MELVKADNVTAPFEGFVNLPAVRQVGLMFGLAASVALGVAVVLWSQEPNYSVLYANLGSKDASQVMDALQKQGVQYKLDDKTGALLVPTSVVHELRLRLADEGLPRSSGAGLDILQQKQEFGASQFLETARYQHALEGELARSITTINSVENARVHLALPKQTAFIRERQQPSASVLVSLYPGRTLEEAQVAAITHMVASSIPNLEPGRVTVVDQSGRLLSSKPPTNAAVNQEQFEYTRKLEDSYIARIENIIAPIVGTQGVRAQVSAEVDFTVTEQTQESYNPDLPALRSEQVYEERSATEGAQGIPGALTNTPPATPAVPERAAGQAGAAAGVQTGRSLNRATKNYELDRTISHSKLATGQVRRLSVAVVVDDRQSINQNGEVVREPRSAEEMERIAALVREAVGYNAQRGDTVNVINASFQTAQAVEPLPEPPLWKQPWVMDAGKQLLGALVVILLLFGVLRPLLRALATVKPPPAPVAEHGMSEDRLTLGGPGGVMQLPQQNTYEGNIAMIRDMARQDPKHVAQVVKTWVSGDEK
ncbi:flagellar basal-body MS-ring/collar protein FliF [Sulfurivermis fontis]|uniref:flagellar basal-body MS-ring/collar protein FliF n=1 Tax=Sulfurivermis fontis TaxID=1972068 RepID=UPI000FDC4FB8|nr:flagellar basal-body MS-ring/collar protein FliF [Sulfurivermis fontis]